MATDGQASFTVVRPEDVDWSRAMRLFSLRCRSLNLSLTTQALYAVRLGQWRHWLTVNGDPGPASVTSDHIRAYLAEMKAERGWKDDTVDSAFRILKTLFHWIEREGLLIRANPMLRVERPRREKKLIRPFSDGQLRAFLGAISRRDALGARDFALCSLLVDTGLRITEALTLTVQDVDFGEGALRCMGKGKKERLVPMGQVARRALLDWMKYRGEIAGQDRLFCNRFGQALTRRRVGDFFQKYGRDAGIEGVRVSPHTLRHTFAITFLRNGGDVLSLQKILGHACLTMTRRYADLADSDVLFRHRQASPLDRLGPLPNDRRRVKLK